MYRNIFLNPVIDLRSNADSNFRLWTSSHLPVEEIVHFRDATLHDSNKQVTRWASSHRWQELAQKPFICCYTGMINTFSSQGAI